MSTRRKPLPVYRVGNWEIEKRPNTFAERYPWEAVRVVGEYKRVGFLTLKAAREFCEANT